jgi:hypothetical protein
MSKDEANAMSDKRLAGKRRFRGPFTPPSEALFYPVDVWDRCSCGWIAILIPGMSDD